MYSNVILTWASLALLKKYKELPHRQVQSRLDACLTHTHRHVIYICLKGSFYLSLHFLSQEMTREWGTAVVNPCNTLHLSQAHITALYIADPHDRRLVGYAILKYRNWRIFSVSLYESGFCFFFIAEVHSYIMLPEQV